MKTKVELPQHLQKALLAKTVNTVELDSGLQISGILSEVIQDELGQPVYLKFCGHTQLSYQRKQIEGRGTSQHAQGFGTPVGGLSSPVVVKGVLIKETLCGGQLCIKSFKDCTVTFRGLTLFHPEWGVFDMAVGNQVVSVFGGPADRQAYGESEDGP